MSNIKTCGHMWKTYSLYSSHFHTSCILTWQTCEWSKEERVNSVNLSQNSSNLSVLRIGDVTVTKTHFAPSLAPQELGVQKVLFEEPQAVWRALEFLHEKQLCDLGGNDLVLFFHRKKGGDKRVEKVGPVKMWGIESWGKQRCKLSKVRRSCWWSVRRRRSRPSTLGRRAGWPVSLL